MITPAVPRLAFALALALAPALAACPSASAPRACEGASCEPDPVLALEAYRDALVAGRPREAFAWIHPDAAEGLDAAGFEALFARHRDALVAQAEDLLVRARAAAPKLRARVATGAGEVILEHTPEGWRLTHPVGAPAP